MMNDWEHVVAMYLTGEGTPDGRPLRDITRGDGRRVEDRKLLEKRRTIGKTYEKLGRDLFEKSIGYKQDGKYRRKQKMYHVIARCRIVNALRKAGDPFPNDPDDLTALIDRKLIEKANAGSAARSSGNNQNNNNNNGNGIGNGNNGNSGNPNGNSNRTGGGAVSRLLASNPTPTVVRAPLPPGSEGATVLPRRS